MVKRVRWGKWFGESMLWTLLAAGPPVVLLPSCLHEVNFHWHAKLVAGKVLDHGVDAVSDGGGGRHGSYTTVRQFPWLDVVPLRNGDGPACRIDSQTRIFGDFMSDNPEVVKRLLRQVAVRSNFFYYALAGATPADADCRVFRRTDPYTVLMVAFMFVLASGLAWMSWSSLDDPDFLYP